MSVSILVSASSRYYFASATNHFLLLSCNVLTCTTRCMCSMSLSMASTLNCATFFVSFSCSASFRYFQSHSMWSHNACIILGAQSDAFNLIFSILMCCLSFSIHCLPICSFIKLSHPILSCSLNANLR
jgi:hypothetical protein